MDHHNDNKILGDLTKAELLAAVPPNTFGSNLRKLTWPQIVKVVHDLPDDILDMICKAAEEKDDEREQIWEQRAEKKCLKSVAHWQEVQRKRKEESHVEAQFRVDDGIGYIDEEMDTERCNDLDDHDHSKYLALPSADEIKKCFRAFRAATSNSALAMSICIVCMRELMSHEGV